MDNGVSGHEDKPQYTVPSDQHHSTLWRCNERINVNIHGRLMLMLTFFVNTDEVQHQVLNSCSQTTLANLVGIMPENNYIKGKLQSIH